MKKPIIFGKWCPVPDHIWDVFDTLTSPEQRMVRAILKISRGRIRTVELTNTDLKRLAGLDKDSLPEARRGLAARGIVDAHKMGKESYGYEILDRAFPDSNESAPAQVPVYTPAAALDVDVDLDMKVVPRDVLFRPPTPTPAPAQVSASEPAPPPAPAIPAPAPSRPVVDMSTWLVNPKRPTTSTTKASPSPLPVATRPVVHPSMLPK